MSEQSEKRRRQRVPFVLEATFQTDEGKAISGTLHDLSMSGFLLQCSETLPVGTNGIIHIVLQSGHDYYRVHAKCTVARVIEGSVRNGIALQITEIDQESSIHLYNIIKFQSA